MSAPVHSSRTAGLARLRRLRGRSLTEFVVRGRQELAKFGERVIPGSAEATDAAFVRLVEPGARLRTAVETAEAVLERLRRAPGGDRRPTFFPAVWRSSDVAAVMARRYVSEQLETIERAERAIDGEFALLGLDRVLFGRPIDWHLEPLSGKRTPVAHWSSIDYLDANVAGDKKVTWELNRHAHFVAFGQAYALTLDDRYAEAFVAQASAWMDRNPPNAGINWASSLELAFRAIAWLWALHLLAPSEAITPTFMLRLLKSLVAHGRHVETYLSHFFSPNTHLTGEALGLYLLGTALPELLPAAAWRDTGLRILGEQLSAQVRDDGVYFEQSTYYHRYTADFYLHTVALARAAGHALPDGFEARVRALLEHLMWITEPNGRTPLVGDDDGGRLLALGWREPRDFRDTVALGAALYDEPRWRFVAGDRAPEVLWVLGPEAYDRYDRIEPAPPEATSRGFEAGGFYVVRDGWTRGAGYALFDCGPHGSLSCGHSHADALSVVFSADGVSWLVDPGTFTYTGDADLRDEFRATAAHNTVTVDDEPQSVPAGPFSWRETATARATSFASGVGVTLVAGEHDGYERFDDPVRHARAVLFVDRDDATPPYLILRDAFGASGCHRYTARYHLPASTTAIVCDGRIVVVDPGGASLTLAAVGSPVAPEPRVDGGWVSEAYAVRSPAPVAAFAVESTGEQELLSVVVPSAELETSPHITRIDEEGRSGITLDFGSALDVVVLGDVAAASETRLQATGALAWARFAAGRPVGACLVRGTRFAVAGGFALAAQGLEFAAIRLGAIAELQIEGCEAFDVELASRYESIVLNGDTFAGCLAGERLTFTKTGSGWTRRRTTEEGC